MLQCLLKVDVLSLTTLATVSASATVPPPPMLNQPAECANLAHLTASLASPTPSAMLAMLDMTLPTVSALLQLSHAPLDSSDTMVFAMAPAQLGAAPKETSARESVPLDHGHTTTVATEPAPPSTRPTMPVWMPAPPKHLSSMESASQVPKLADQANSTMPALPHARTVNFLAPNAHSLPHTVPPVLPD